MPSSTNNPAVASGVTLGQIKGNVAGNPYNLLLIYNDVGDSGSTIFKITSGDNVSLYGMLYESSGSLPGVTHIKYHPWEQIQSQIGANPPYLFLFLLKFKLKQILIKLLNKKILIILIVFLSVTIVHDTLNSYAVEIPQSGELQMKGEYLYNDLPKPINTYKIPYQMLNGTLISIESKDNEGIYATANGESGLLTIKIPKNYPMTNVSYDPIDAPILLINDTEAFLESDVTDCFYEYYVPVKNLSMIKLLFTFVPEPHPFHAQTVSELCIMQTIVITCESGQYPYQNIRNEEVCVFANSVNKLFERGYLISR